MIPVLAKAQVEHELKKNIGKYGAVSFSRSIYDNGDTTYYLTYRNSGYNYLVDVSVTPLKRSELKNLWLRLNDLIKDDGQGVASVTTDSGLTLKKEKTYGLTGIYFWDAEGKNTSIMLKAAKRMENDIYDVLFENSKN